MAYPAPRDVPVLYPVYFMELLTTGGVPPTAENVARLVGRTAFMIGTQGAAYCAQLRDAAAFEIFLVNFARGGMPARRLHLADDMVDWLWAWSARCHDDLRGRFVTWRADLLGPGSLLQRGRDIPPSDAGEPDREEAWRSVFAEHSR
ncbi:hypothetical protein AB0M46_17445 [Dactylosporangium sp. NPDC051485]|uniref:hypothetical protein n=1 Tax=Dactylosporangium sp. NPDC051485 TaxID=3154846 RepID=UPI00342726E6